MNKILQFLIDVLFFFPIYLLLARFFLQAFRCPFNNPLYQSLLIHLRPVLAPFERVVPRFRSWNLAVLVVLYLVCVLKALTVCAFLIGKVTIPAALLLGLVYLLSSMIGMFFVLMIFRVIISFVQPREGNPLIPITYFLTEPLLAPLRRLLPGNLPLDFSPILLFLVFMLIEVLVIAPLAENVIGRLMVGAIGI